MDLYSASWSRLLDDTFPFFDFFCSGESKRAGFLSNSGFFLPRLFLHLLSDSFRSSSALMSFALLEFSFFPDLSTG